MERLQLLDIATKTCQDRVQVSQQLIAGKRDILFLDVAFSGMFPFDLIEKAKAQQTKVVLLPSVYNRTAYKKKPGSLYGADAYLELHHIGDQLLGLFAELVPGYRKQVARLGRTAIQIGERPLRQTELQAQAWELAQLLVADITFYHQERFQQAVTEGFALRLFADELSEGRRLLYERLPIAAELEQDIIEDAFKSLCEHYRRNANKS